jgi:hypothetical protein
LGAANDYIAEIDNADQSIAHALKVVIAMTAVQDISNIHNDFELLRTEIRQLYKKSGTELQPDILSATVNDLAKLVSEALNKSTKAMKPPANES